MTNQFTGASMDRIGAVVQQVERMNRTDSDRWLRTRDRKPPNWDAIANEDIARETYGAVELLKTDRATRSGNIVQAYAPSGVSLDDKFVIIPVAMEDAPETVTRWYIVSGGGGVPIIDATAAEDIQPDSSGNVTLRIGGTTETAHLEWITGGEQISSGKNVRIRWKADHPVSPRYVILQAECEDDPPGPTTP